MVEIRVAWEWKSLSPLHVGSGLSRLGVADSLVQRDPDGNAVIYGEAVKGAIRMGAEQVASWLGAPQHEHYAAQGTAEPRSWPLARLFGGEAVARCTPATLVRDREDPKAGVSSQVVASTSIDRTTGTADDQTLRKTEIVPAGLRFRATYTASVAESEADVVETLLIAALTSVESIGGKAGIGWGRMVLGSVRVTVDGNCHAPAAAVAPDRLERLRCEIGECDSTTATGGAPQSSATVCASAGIQKQRWFKLTITLKEPTCLPDEPEISNKVSTNDWIAATTLRGALAGAWLRSGRSSSEVLSWLAEDTAWTPAFRLVGDELAVPAPCSFVTTKRPLGGTRPVHDTFAGQFPKASDGSDLQWRSIAGDSIVLDGGAPCLATDSGLRETRMHVARDYRTGGKRSGALYARESLVTGTQFVSWARVPHGAFDGRGPKIPTLLIGKRVSSGNGRATLEVTPVDGPDYSGSSDSEQSRREGTCEVIVHLVSPALVYDSDGYPRRNLDLAWWSDEFEHEVCVAASDDDDPGISTAPGRRGGWMTNWKHARAAVTTIEAGSAWRLRCKTPDGAECLRRKLRERAHVGERSHEGFGWIAVDPPWSGRSVVSELAPESPTVPKADGQPTPWPGTNVPARTLAEVARRLANKEPSVIDKAESALQELAGRVRASRGSLEHLKVFYAERAKKKDKWVTLMKLLPKSDSLWDDREQLLYALNLLLTRGSGSGRQ